MRIWKWTLPTLGYDVIEIPHGAKMLTVQMQHGEPQLWALVDEEMYKDRVQIAVYGTGNPIPDNPGEYIGTFQLHNGDLVFHVFVSPNK